MIERVFFIGFLLFDDTGNQTTNGIDHYHSRQFTTGQYIIADRIFLCCKCTNTFIKALIMTTHKCQLFFLGQCTSSFLSKWLPLWRHEDYLGIRGIQIQIIAQCRHNRLRLQYHTGTTAKRIIIYRFVLVGRVFTKVNHIDVQNIFLLCFTNKTAAQWAFKHFRKQ